MKNYSILLFTLVVLTTTSCSVTQQSYQPTIQRDASSYSAKEKNDFLNAYGIIEYRKKFGR